MMLDRRTVALAAAVVVVAVFCLILRAPDLVIDFSTLLGKSFTLLEEPQAGMPYLLPDVLRQLNATGLPDKKWEVSLGKHLANATVSEAGIDYWANQIRYAHAADTGAHAFAAKCIDIFSREDEEAAELLWGWKVALGTTYEDQKNRCCRSFYTLGGMRKLAGEKPAKKLMAQFVEDIIGICTQEMFSQCRYLPVQP
ncbi:g5564 [Coccomyxa elongata]